jgi:thioredoxin reductase (NADPH)
VFPDGTVLTDPSNAELTRAAGSPVHLERMEFDVIVGCGPAGLSAAMYGASEGFSTLVVDEDGVGGRATSSSLIRDYLGFARGGRRLAQQAYKQAWVFEANFAFMQRVVDLRRDHDGLFVSLSESGLVRARAVLLAMGASYRRLGVPALEALKGAGVFYGGPTSRRRP